MASYSLIASVFTPIGNDFDVLPGTTDTGFQTLATEGISNLCGLCDKPTVMSFSQLTKRHNIRMQDFSHYGITLEG